MKLKVYTYFKLMNSATNSGSGWRHTQNLGSDPGPEFQGLVAEGVQFTPLGIVGSLYMGSSLN